MTTEKTSNKRAVVRLDNTLHGDIIRVELTETPAVTRENLDKWVADIASLECSNAETVYRVQYQARMASRAWGASKMVNNARLVVDDRGLVSINTENRVSAFWADRAEIFTVIMGAPEGHLRDSGPGLLRCVNVALSMGWARLVRIEGSEDMGIEPTAVGSAALLAEGLR